MTSPGVVNPTTGKPVSSSGKALSRGILYQARVGGYSSHGPCHGEPCIKLGQGPATRKPISSPALVTPITYKYPRGNNMQSYRNNNNRMTSTHKSIQKVGFGS